MSSLRYHSDSYPNDMVIQDVQEMQYFEKTHIVDFPDNEIHSDSNIIPYSQYLQELQDADSQMDDLIQNRNVKFAAFQQEVDTLKETLSNQVKEKESLSTTLTVFKTECKEKESKYMDKKIVFEKQNKELENIICKMYRSTQAMHMLTKPQVFYYDTHKQALGYQNPFHLKKAQRIKPTLYDGSVISKKHDVISMIDDDETLILDEESRSKMLDKQNDTILIKQKINIAPIDYLKLNNLKEDFGKRFVTQQELSTEQAFWLKHSSISETPVNSHTPVRIEVPSELPKCLKLETELLKKKDFIEKDVYDKLIKSYSTLEKHCISLEVATQLNQEIFQKDNYGENQSAPTFNQLFEINELKAQSQENNTVIRKLKDKIKSLSGKDSVKNVKKDIDEIETINIELEHSVAKILSENENLKKERDHLKTIYKDQFDSIKKTRARSKEHSDSLIAQINAKSVKKSYLNAQLQEKELLVYVSKTCPSSPKASEKLVDVTPLNKEKRVRFADPLTSSSNTQKTQDSNKPLLHSTGVKCFTSASRSKPLGNTKNNRISQPSISNKTNKVGDQSRSVKSRRNKKKRVDKPECNADVMQSMLNANSVSKPISNALIKHSMRNAKFKSMCAIYNKCLFDANYDMCLIDYVNDVNVRRTFTIIRNRFPLTRITSTKEVLTKDTTKTSVVTPTQGIIVYSRRPKASRSVRSSSKVKIVESNTPNTTKPNQSWGSTVSNVPSSSLINCRLSKLFCGTIRFGNDHIAKIMGYGDYQMGNMTISQIYYVEGLGHNLFSMGQFCDSSLENGVVERRNHTLVEAACTMLIFSKALLFLWAEAVVTACYTQNRSLIRKRHNKTPYELLHDRKPDLSYLQVFGALCYPTNDSEDLDKLKPKADIGIFVGYTLTKKAF
ncbi:retrovirus-related pol polyprotein from transposon TNT 1-94 [Tanacetum coccineum]